MNILQVAVVLLFAPSLALFFLKAQWLRNRFLGHCPHLADADRRTNDGGDKFFVELHQAMQVLFGQLSKPFQVGLGRIEVLRQQIAAMAKPEGKTNPLMGGLAGPCVASAANRNTVDQAIEGLPLFGTEARRRVRLGLGLLAMQDGFNLIVAPQCEVHIEPAGEDDTEFGMEPSPLIRAALLDDN